MSHGGDFIPINPAFSYPSGDFTPKTAAIPHACGEPPPKNIGFQPYKINKAKKEVLCHKA